MRSQTKSLVLKASLSPGALPSLSDLYLIVVHVSLCSIAAFSRASISASSSLVAFILADSWLSGFSGALFHSLSMCFLMEFLSAFILSQTPSSLNSCSTRASKAMRPAFLRFSGCFSILKLAFDSVRPSASRAFSMPVALSSDRGPSTSTRAWSMPFVFLTAVFAFLGAARLGRVFSSSASRASRSAFFRAASAFFSSDDALRHAVSSCHTT